MKIQFICLASGSSGNCYYIGVTPSDPPLIEKEGESYGILIDAGIAVRTIRKSLRDVGIPFERVSAVFVTHDHADHIKSLGTLGERCNLPIYATRETHVGINHNYVTTHKLTSCMRYVEKDKPLTFRDFTITPFEVPHDANDTVGYCIELLGRTFVFATDVGQITDTASAYIDRANYLILEANYDPEMLQRGPYPPHLKKRISGPNGHLSNEETAAYLAEHLAPHTSHVWLCHLSAENNHPDLAYKTIEWRLRERGIIAGKDFYLESLKRTTPSALFEFDVDDAGIDAQPQDDNNA